MTALRTLVDTWLAVRALGGRKEKCQRMADLFGPLEPDDLRRAAADLSGEIPSCGVGWALLAEARQRADEAARPLPLFAALAPAPPAPPRPLTLADVEACLAELAGLSGSGAGKRRAAVLAGLLARAGAEEREWLAALLLGELRQGALRALVLEALAAARGVDAEALRRAVMLAGSLAGVVEDLGRRGAAALAEVHLTPLLPVEPMLAATSASVGEALAELGGEAAVEWKLDGVRVQLHRAGDEVRVFSRSLRDVTTAAPELVELARALPAASFILDGEVVAFDTDGRPLPFQDLMSRFQREEGKAEPRTRTGTIDRLIAVEARGRQGARRENTRQYATDEQRSRPGWIGHEDRSIVPTRVPSLEPLFFDALLVDGEALVDRPDRERRAALERLLPEARLVPRRVARDEAEAAAVLAEALARGHEGVVMKSLEAPYVAGRRGGVWRKVKLARTVDLVILAAEWGHGRRRGFLSNLHLGARDPGEPSRFWTLGKTFKGLTDAMLAELTEGLLPLAVERGPHVVVVRPERVVEIAFDGLQRSSRYDSGLALRFARVKRFRPDKQASEATTIDEVRALAGPDGRGPAGEG